MTTGTVGDPHAAYNISSQLTRNHACTAKIGGSDVPQTHARSAMGNKWRRALHALCNPY